MKALVLTLLFVNLYFTGEFKKAKENFDESYFPVNPKKTLIYESDFGDTKFSITGSENSYTITNKSDDFDYKQTLLRKDGKYYITKTEQDVDVFLFFSSSSKVTYNKPALRFPFPLQKGDSWKWEGYEYSEDDSTLITISGKVVGTEEITVPAGEFNCLKIETEIGGEDESKDVVTEWLAEDVGLVKIEAQVGKGGVVGLLQSILGLETLKFELKEIISD
ncbi:MAG: hypothetical protein ACEPO8_05760 [Rhodothermaceae bacterium]